MSLAEFDWPFQIALDKNNRWVKMSTCIPGMNWLKVIMKGSHAAREFSEQIIDHLYPETDWLKKPRTYRQKARKACLAVAKRRRRAIKQQLQYLRRNLGHIERLLECWPEGAKLPLPGWLLHRYWVIPYVYAQQWEMQ